MSEPVEFRLAELERRLNNLLRYGTIAEADYSRARVRVQSGELLSGWLPWLTHRASNDTSWHAPEVGEQVVLVSPCGDPAQAVVLPAIYQNAHPAGQARCDIAAVTFADGMRITYDRAGHHLQIDCPGDITFTCSGNFKVTAARIDLN